MSLTHTLALTAILSLTGVFAQAVDAGIIASNRGNARVAPTPRRNVRRCRPFVRMNSIPMSSG